MNLESRAIRRVTWRLIPFLMLCYFVAYLDRANVGFAALQMNHDLGLTETMFGVGAGIFFIAYFFFEVPSNLALNKFGARRWIARIMFSWGIVAGAMGFIPQISHVFDVSANTTYVVLRVLLGIAEAGFFPGIIYYITLWFPGLYRARMIGLFMAAIPISVSVGSPISGVLLYLHGFGLAGWQWMYIIEALPALVLSVVVLFYLTDRPENAKWLPADERAWLTARLSEEDRKRRAACQLTVLQSLGNTRVLLLAFIYFAMNGAGYAVSFFLPQIIRGFGLSYGMTGLVAMLPYLFSIFMVIYWGRHSDKAAERREHVGLALLVSGLCLAGTTLVNDPVPKVFLFILAVGFQYAANPVFWALPTAFLSGPAAAAGIAITNSIGNLSGFLGPYLMGSVKDGSGSYTNALLAIAIMLGFGMVVALSLAHDRNLELPGNSSEPDTEGASKIQSTV